MSTLILSDMAALKHHVNSEVGISDYVEVSQERIRQFADLTEDWHRIHTEPDRAKRESPFGATVAHGFLTIAFLSRLLTPSVGNVCLRILVSCVANSIRVVQQVRVGTRVPLP